MAATGLTTPRATEGQVSLLKKTVFPPTRPEDVFGCLAYTGAPKSIAEMAAWIALEAMRRATRTP